MPRAKVAQVLDDGRGTWAGREVQTDRGPVIVPQEIKKGDAILIEYRATSSYGLWFYKRKA